MTNLNNGYHDRSMFECVDDKPEYIFGAQAFTGGGLFYFVSADCDGTGTTGHCPPYEANRAITCAVCTQ